MISVSCSCGRRFKAEDHHAGKRTRCPICGQLLTIGRPSAVAASNVSDNGEVPSWWFPSAPAPTQSASGSNPDDIQTMVVPASREAHLPAAGNPSTSEPSKASAPVFSRAMIFLALTFSALVLLVLGAVVWLQGGGRVERPEQAQPAPTLQTTQEESTPLHQESAVPQKTPIRARCGRSPVGPEGSASSRRLELKTPASRACLFLSFRLRVERVAETHGSGSPGEGRGYRQSRKRSWRAKQPRLCASYQGSNFEGPQSDRICHHGIWQATFRSNFKRC